MKGLHQAEDDRCHCTRMLNLVVSDQDVEVDVDLVVARGPVPDVTEELAASMVFEA
jgi:hypothetical protein